MLWSLFFCSACSNKSNNADRLNDIAYYHYYRSLDSVRIYADSILENKTYDALSRAEALNHLAFYYIAKMDYEKADSLLTLASKTTKNHIERLVTAVQQMRLCQRRSDNKSFYEYRHKALQHIHRISEEIPIEHSSDYNTSNGISEVSALSSGLSSHMLKRLRYAETEFQIVSSAYFYYVSLKDEAAKAILSINDRLLEEQDTAQYISYLYSIGSGGIISSGKQTEIFQEEFNYLADCYLLANQGNYKYWKANALQAIAEHLLDNLADSAFYHTNAAFLKFINTENISPENLPGYLSEKSLSIFTNYGDYYQKSAAWRTLSECYFHVEDYPGSIYCLDNALNSNKRLKKSPSLLSSIYENLSISFAAINKKQQSDEYRNKFLDLQEFTRQDRQYEARATQLDRSLKSLNIILFIVVTISVILILTLLYLLIRRHINISNGTNSKSTLLQKEEKHYQELLRDISEDKEEILENIEVQRINLSRQQMIYEENRARLSLIDSLTPLIGRMLHEMECLTSREEYETKKTGRMEYVGELAQSINSSNNVLTDWIKLQSGIFLLQIETINLKEIFSLIEKNAASFRQHGITLITHLDDESLSIKADKALTIFMLNTLCDNARKYTPAGGTVTIDAKPKDQMVEISVTDTGVGMTEAETSNIFDKSVIIDQTSKGGSAQLDQQSHGYGILNCKGIIEKYRKTSPIFSSSTIGVESKISKGTKFFFTLPRSIRGLIVILLSVFAPINSHADDDSPDSALYLSASTYADSLYMMNIKGCHMDALHYAELCTIAINDIYRSTQPSNVSDTLMMYDSLSSYPEIRWWVKSAKMPYDIILTLRNETAVAALGLHRWDLYNYNNAAYIQLFREMSEDKSLSEYCLGMQHTESNRNVAIMLLILLLVCFIPIYYLLYYRYVILDTKKGIAILRKNLENSTEELESQKDMFHKLQFESDRLRIKNNIIANNLSSIKHETMYYPSRILNMIERHESINDMEEILRYYRALSEVLTHQARSNASDILPPSTLRNMAFEYMFKICKQKQSQIIPADYDDQQYEYYVIPIINNDVYIIKALTQTVRDLGETYGLRRCGVIETDANIKVILPKTRN